MIPNMGTALTNEYKNRVIEGERKNSLWAINDVINDFIKGLWGSLPVSSCHIFHGREHFRAPYRM